MDKNLNWYDGLDEETLRYIKYDKLDKLTALEAVRILAVKYRQQSEHMHQLSKY